MNAIHDEWVKFERAVVPQDASDVQRRAMKQAFYSGASVVLTMQLRLEDFSDEACAGIIQGWHDECHMFAMSIVAGTA